MGTLGVLVFIMPACCWLPQCVNWYPLIWSRLWTLAAIYVADCILPGVAVLAGGFIGLIFSIVINHHAFGSVSITFPVMVMVNWLYRFVMESLPCQATLGKILFNIHVTDLDGQRLSPQKSSARHINKIASTLTSVSVMQWQDSQPSGRRYMTRSLDVW